MSKLTTLDLSEAKKRGVGKPPGSQNTANFVESVIGTEETNRRFVEAYLRTQNRGKAAEEVFGDTIKHHKVKAIKMMKRPAVQALLRQSLASANATPIRAAEIIADATNAVKYVGKDEREVPDHGVRLKSADMIIKVFDAYPGKSKDGWESEGSKHLHLHLEEPLAVRKFILLNGRLPNEEERKELIGDVIDVQVENEENA